MNLILDIAWKLFAVLVMVTIIPLVLLAMVPTLLMLVCGHVLDHGLRSPSKSSCGR